MKSNVIRFPNSKEPERRADDSEAEHIETRVYKVTLHTVSHDDIMRRLEAKQRL